MRQSLLTRLALHTANLLVIALLLLPMAAIAMEAHLEKLEGEGRLPAGLEP